MFCLITFFLTSFFSGYLFCFFLDEFKHDKVKKKTEPSCTMKCLTRCTDRTVRLFPCLKDNNTIINRISSMKSFRLDRISGFASFIKKKKNINKKQNKKNKIGKGRDGGASVKTTENDGFDSSNGDEITVSEIELREWSEPLNPALGIKEEEDELSMTTSTSAFMAKPPPSPMRPSQVDQKKKVDGNKSKIRREIREEMKNEMKQMEQDKQNVERQLRNQTKQMKQQMKQQEMQQMKQQKQQKQEKERFQREKKQSEQKYQDQIHEMQQTLKKIKTDNSLVVAKLAIAIKNKK